jgi:hypothetical protein
MPPPTPEDMMRTFIRTATIGLVCLMCQAVGQSQDEKPADALAQDLKRLQGKWELLHGSDGSGGPGLYSVKEIAGNRETLRRYDAKTGMKIREHAVDFTLSVSGDVRVFTFYGAGGDPKQGESFIYKVDDRYFYDVSGLLQGDAYRNYQDTPVVWRWKRIEDPNAPEPRITSMPRKEIDPVVRKELESRGARISERPDGYNIDIRRKPGFGDAELDIIVDCPQVLDLTLEGVAITDRGIEKLRALSQLTRLIMNDCAISGAGLKTLAELPLRETLVSIGLRGTQIKEDDLRWLKDFKRLERVDVSHTSVTDTSLTAIEMLPLKVLTVTKTPVSAAAAEQLLKKHPQLILNR